MRCTNAIFSAVLLTFAAPAFADEYVIMKVNNQDISSSEVQSVWEGLFPAGQAPSFEGVKPEVRDRVLRAVMAESILRVEALKSGIDKSDMFKREMEALKNKLIVRDYLDRKTSEMITDADLKKSYDTMIAGMKDEKEIRARHILVSTEQEAKDVKKQLDSGKVFEDVARDYSKDPASAKQGGDLGYFTKGKMVKEFGDAAFSMKKGEVSGVVKSNFGYHIIKVEDIRKATSPTFSEVKDQLRSKLQEKELNDYVASLVKAADVKSFDAKGKELPFNKNLTAQSEGNTATEDKPMEKPAISEKSAKDNKSGKADKSR